MIGGHKLSRLPLQQVKTITRLPTRMSATTIPPLGSSSTNKRVLLWFRNDLRLHDNEIVDKAARLVKSGTASEVLPVYVFDPRFFEASRWGTPKTGPHRAQFLLDSVLDLKQRLKAVGSDLLVTAGSPEVVLPSLACPAAQTSVLAQSEVTSEETDAEVAVKDALRPVNGTLELVWGSSMFHKDDLPFRRDCSDIPDVFTPFKQKCEDRSKVRPCLPTPTKGQLPLPAEDFSTKQYVISPTTIEELSAALPAGLPKLITPVADKKGVLDFKGGESVALDRLKYYLWDSDLIATYFDTRNGMLGGDYSTKFAPWLAHGCLSPRLIYNEIKKYEAQRTANKSTYWVIFELIWRDFFKFFALKHGNAIFFKGGTAGKRREWASNPELMARWKEGLTGWPLVDANMRELKATGFMSNRGRQNVASFLVLDLGLDWRLGGDWFESLLLDYDVSSNWGNWVSAAGLTGGRVNHFNITKQAKDYDPQGDYVRHWCPELANVPASRVHEPWLMSKEEQQRYGCIIGVDYPAAIPSSQFAGRNGGGGGSGGHPSRFHNGGGRGDGPQGRGSGPGGNGGRGGRSGGSSGRGGGKSERKNAFRAKSAFEMYG